MGQAWPVSMNGRRSLRDGPAEGNAYKSGLDIAAVNGVGVISICLEPYADLNGLSVGQVDVPHRELWSIHDQKVRTLALHVSPQYTVRVSYATPLRVSPVPEIHEECVRSRAFPQFRIIPEGREALLTLPTDLSS